MGSMECVCVCVSLMNSVGNDALTQCSAYIMRREKTLQGFF